MKNCIFLATILAVLISCNGNQSITPNSSTFDFSGEMTSSSSFSIRQKSKDEKVELSIQGDPIVLGISKTSKQFDASKLTIKITEYKNVLPQYSAEFNLILMGKGREKTNSIVKTWTATSGVVDIQLIKGQPIANNNCRNLYTITVKLNNIKFVTSDKKESIILKSQSFENMIVGWCEE